MDEIKAEAARSEYEGDGASDVEALFASKEEAKPPIILADAAR
ncbi:AAA family ATPase [Bacillus cereus]|nr:AAA family ATPase [Bacillus cereus]